MGTPTAARSRETWDDRWLVPVQAVDQPLGTDDATRLQQQHRQQSPPPRASDSGGAPVVPQRSRLPQNAETHEPILPHERICADEENRRTVGGGENGPAAEHCAGPRPGKHDRPGPLEVPGLSDGVEPRGVEPLTSAMQRRRSTN